jgi:hypothetical protein
MLKEANDNQNSGAYWYNSLHEFGWIAISIYHFQQENSVAYSVVRQVMTDDSKNFQKLLLSYKEDKAGNNH